MSRKPPIFRQTDVRKAFQAAQAAGVTARVDITRDGKLSIVPVEKPLNDPPPPPGKREAGAEGRGKAGFLITRLKKGARMSEDPDTSAMTGTVAWTAEGRKAMRTLFTEISTILSGLPGPRKAIRPCAPCSRSIGNYIFDIGSHKC
jgi:hypothetical protein